MSGNVDSRARIRVLIADDHPIVRQMVRMACTQRPEIEVVAEAGDGVDALEQCRRIEPDVLVLDLMLPRLTGVEVAERLRAEGSHTHILVLSGRDDQSAVLDALRAGAHGYLEKTVLAEEVAAAIEAVADGASLFSSDQERTAYAHLGDLMTKARETSRTIALLTRRERQVLDLIAEGLSTRQMASQLKVSERTVETHIANVYQKLNVRTRVEAVYRAAGLGLVDLGSR